MNISSMRIINLVLGFLGLVITGILVFNGFIMGFCLKDLLEFSGALLISIGFITQGIFQSVPWYSLILIQMGAALYISPLCLYLYDNPSNIFGWLCALIVLLMLFDGAKRIIGQLKAYQNS